MQFYKGMKSRKDKPFSSAAGQIVVEYVLLLAIAVSIAMITVTVLIKRGDASDPSSAGALIQQWYLLQKTIGDDVQN